MIDDFKPASGPAKSPQAMPNGPSETKTTSENSETFRTPDEIAAAQILETSASASTGPVSAPLSPRPVVSRDTDSWWQKLGLAWPPSKREYLLIIVAVLVLGGGGFFVLHGMHKPPKTPVANATTKKIVKQPAPAAPTIAPSTLTGLPVAPGVNQIPVTGVMVENSDFARPQSGLGQAGVVFEAIAEGGITRFLALFQDTAPGNVGPIRSARPYYEQWALGFDAGYAHVGGSPEALNDIQTWHVRDLDEFYNAGSYHRISARQAPHNVYTGIGTLNQLEVSKGWPHSTFTGFARKKDAPVKQPTAGTINLTLSGPDYNVKYAYDVPTNSYKRSEGGAPQMDANTNTQISPKVVVAMVTHYSLEADHYHSDYNVIGSGPVYIFQDGTVATGEWAKSNNTSQITFTTASGSPLKLNAGQTWITAVAGNSDVSYSP